MQKPTSINLTAGLMVLFTAGSLPRKLPTRRTISHHG
jgi:hypothetical protein